MHTETEADASDRGPARDVARNTTAPDGPMTETAFEGTSTRATSSGDAAGDLPTGKERALAVLVSTASMGATALIAGPVLAAALAIAIPGLVLWIVAMALIRTGILPVAHLVGARTDKVFPACRGRRCDAAGKDARAQLQAA